MAKHLQNAFSQPLAPTGMQGSTPLDVAAASVIDNNELALALQEQDLEKVWREEAWTLGAPADSGPIMRGLDGTGSNQMGNNFQEKNRTPETHLWN